MAFDSGPIIGIILGACAFLITFWAILTCFRRYRQSHLAPPPPQMPVITVVRIDDAQPPEQPPVDPDPRNEQLAPAYFNQNFNNSSDL